MRKSERKLPPEPFRCPVCKGLGTCQDPWTPEIERLCGLCQGSGRRPQEKPKVVWNADEVRMLGRYNRYNG